MTTLAPVLTATHRLYQRLSVPPVGKWGIPTLLLAPHARVASRCSSLTFQLHPTLSATTPATATQLRHSVFDVRRNTWAYALALRCGRARSYPIPHQRVSSTPTTIQSTLLFTTNSPTAADGSMISALPSPGTQPSHVAGSTTQASPVLPISRPPFRGCALSLHAPPSFPLHLHRLPVAEDAGENSTLPCHADLMCAVSTCHCHCTCLALA